MSLVRNILDNYSSVQNDFTGVWFNVQGIVAYIINILIAMVFFFVSYKIGEKIRLKFYRDDKQYHLFINIVLGFTTIGTGIGLLGMFSLLTPLIFSIYLFLICVIAVSPLPKVSISKKTIIKQLKYFYASHNKFVIASVLLFALISFLRLSIPDTTEDGYHTDLARLYLETHTTMHETRDLLHVIPYPQLAEMVYTIPIFLGHKDAVRFIHFGFYLLIILLLFKIAKNKENQFAVYAPLLFASAPIVIRYAATQYTDFFMLLPFLLAVFLIRKNAFSRHIVLAGLLYGTALAVKTWVLVYLPVFLIYIFLLNKHVNIKTYLRLSTLFIFSALLVPFVWHLRSYIIIGNPIYPFFSKLEHFDKLEPALSPSVSSYLSFNYKMFSVPNMIVLSPLFFVGVIFSIAFLKNIFAHVKKSPLLLFWFLLFMVQLFIQVYPGRYLIPWYTITSILISAGLYVVLPKNKIIKYGFVVISGFIFTYYFLNTLLTLPYGFGWADTDKYLTRVLYRDNASYYDFDHKFHKYISKEDFVATYGIINFYYADFHYSEIGYIFSDSNRSFNALNEKKVTKLLIKGGDFEWFCKRLSLTECTMDRVKLLATYPDDVKKFNLYSIEK